MRRREFIKNILGLSSISTITPLMANDYWNVDWSIERPNDFPLEEALFEITQGKKVLSSEKISLTIPEIAENGAVVPFKVNIDSPMTKEDYVTNIYILTKHGNSRVIYVELTPANGRARFGTRIKMKETGEVFVVAKLSDGSFIGTRGFVKVTVGGGN